jgi:hypothetical protein
MHVLVEDVAEAHLGRGVAEAQIVRVSIIDLAGASTPAASAKPGQLLFRAVMIRNLPCNTAPVIE